MLESSVPNRKSENVSNALKTKLRPILGICQVSLLMNPMPLQKCFRKPKENLLPVFACVMSTEKALLRPSDFSLYTPLCVLVLYKIRYILLYYIIYLEYCQP